MIEQVTSTKGSTVPPRPFLTRENSVTAMRASIERHPETETYNKPRIALVKGVGIVEPEMNMHHPEIIPTTAKEFIENFWSGAELDAPQWQADQHFFSWS